MKTQNPQKGILDQVFTGFHGRKSETREFFLIFVDRKKNTKHYVPQ